MDQGMSSADFEKGVSLWLDAWRRVIREELLPGLVVADLVALCEAIAISIYTARLFTVVAHNSFTVSISVGIGRN